MMTRNFTLLLLMMMLIGTALGCGGGDDENAETTETPLEDVVEPEDTSEPQPTPDADPFGGKDTETPPEDTDEPPIDIVEPECTADTDCTTEEICSVAVCDEGVCAVAHAENGAACDDLDACTVGDACTDGTCIAGTEPLSCDDENVCTDDSCESESGCGYINNSADCDDGDFCTAKDTCQEKSCVGAVANTCDDEDPCTNDLCNTETQACENTPANDVPCDDGQACTEDDFCVEGLCTAGVSVCPLCTVDPDCIQDENLCNGDLICAEGFCTIDTSTVIICDPAAPCYSNQCNAETGLCESSMEEDEAACEDGNPCTDGDSCTAGECIAGDELEDCIPGCFATTQAGCGGCSCEDCVCEIDSFCCETQWDVACVSLCASDCGIECELPEPDAGCNSFPTPGCGGCACEECVCAIDSFCCQNSWDNACVLACANDCGGNCETQGDCSPGYIVNCNGGCTLESWLADSWCDSALNCELFDWDAGDCEAPCFPECENKDCGDDGCGGTCGICEAGSACYDDACQEHCGNDACETELDSSGSALVENCSTCAADCGDCAFSYGCEILEQPSCGGCACEACVCEEDSFCCDVTWDTDCVVACAFDCGGCDYSAGCFENTSTDEAGAVTLNPGCDDCSCQECVCAIDAACCDVAWDLSCAVKCQEDCNTSCDLETCSSDLDCFDGNSCTIESCDPELQVCNYQWSETCCQTDADCDDGNSCTVNTCNDKGQCNVTAAPGEACCPEAGDVFSSDFESSVPFAVYNSSNAGGWQITQSNSLSETHSLWYGSSLTGDLNFGSSEGTLTSAPISIPPSYSISLSYWQWAGQSSTVELVLLTGEEKVTVSSGTTSTTEEWEEITFNLTPWGGQTVVLEYSFSSSGAPSAGVFLDDVAIVSDCLFPVCGDGECNGDEQCFNCAEDCAYPDTCPENDGCLPWQNPGCVECSCQEDVCADNPSCCDEAWSTECVLACDDTGIMDCGGGEGCYTSTEPTCNGCSCEDCVCDMDSFCCANAWDSLCVNQCKNQCGEWCPPEECSDTQVQNCSGGCTTATWLGDNFCDSALNCEATDWDAGDCEPGPTVLP